jgi:hypothetical protein
MTTSTSAAATAAPIRGAAVAAVTHGPLRVQRAAVRSSGAEQPCEQECLAQPHGACRWTTVTRVGCLWPMTAQSTWCWSAIATAARDDDENRNPRCDCACAGTTETRCGTTPSASDRTSPTMVKPTPTRRPLRQLRGGSPRDQRLQEHSPPAVGIPPRVEWTKRTARIPAWPVRCDMRQCRTRGPSVRWARLDTWEPLRNGPGVTRGWLGCSWPG